MKVGGRALGAATVMCLELRLRRFFPAAFVTACFLYVGPASPSLADDSVKIGAIFGLSGNVAPYGEWARNGVELARNELNGKNRRKLHIIFEDNHGEPARSVTAFHKLCNTDDVKFVMTFLSSVALAISPLANRAQIVQMDVSATTPAYSSPGDFTFRTGIVASQLARQTGNLLADQFKLKSVGALYIENEFGEGMFRVFSSTFSGRVPFSETFRAEDTDFHPQLLKLKSSGLSDVWLVGHLRESGMLLKQAQELGLKLNVYTDAYSVEGADFLSAAGKAGNGVIYVAPGFDVGDRSPEVSSFVSHYREQYHADPTYFAAQAYDGFLALSAAIFECADVTATCVRDRLYGLDFTGASGRIKFDWNGDVQKSIVLKQVKNNQFVHYLPTADT